MKPSPFLLAFALASVLLIGCGGGGESPTPVGNEGSAPNESGTFQATPSVSLKGTANTSTEDLAYLANKPSGGQVVHLAGINSHSDLPQVIWTLPAGQARLIFQFTGASTSTYRLGDFKPTGSSSKPLAVYLSRSTSVTRTIFAAQSGTVRVTKADKSAFAATLENVRFASVPDGKTGFVLNGTVTLR